LKNLIHPIDQNTLSTLNNHSRKNTMPAAYILVDSLITDPELFKQYAALAPAAVAAAGGEYLARGGRNETLEGDWNPPRVTVLRFPSYATARSFYDSAAYQSVRQHRVGATQHFNMVLVEGV
jgi:uncharacterized protein (DUF1330 family)